MIDQTQGLFGLAFTSTTTLTSDVTIRQAMSMAIDRTALVQALSLPNAKIRETLLPTRMDEATEPASPDWSGYAIEARRAEAQRRVANWIVRHKSPPQLRVAIANSPGARLLFARIADDWRRIGLDTIAVNGREKADLKVIDEVAPSDSVNWYFSRLSCEADFPCDPRSEEVLADARKAESLSERAKDYAIADQIFTANAMFIPIGNPYRWCLTSAVLPGLRSSGFGLHPIIRLRSGRN